MPIQRLLFRTLTWLVKLAGQTDESTWNSHANLLFMQQSNIYCKFSQSRFTARLHVNRQVMKPSSDCRAVIMLSACTYREAYITADGRRTRLGAAHGLRQSTHWRSARRRCGQHCYVRHRGMAQCTCTVWRSMRGALLHRMEHKCVSSGCIACRSVLAPQQVRLQMRVLPQGLSTVVID